MKEYLSLAKDKMSEEFLAKFVQGLMGRKRASELFGQSCIYRVYEHHKSGAILCPILPYHWQSKGIGYPPKDQLNDVNRILPYKWDIAIWPQRFP